MSKDLVAKKEQSLVVMDDLEADAGQGSEMVGQDDLALPFLKVLSQLSPEIESVEGAKAGMIYDTVSGKVYDGQKGVVVVPAYYERKFIEWAPRGSGNGAPINIYSATSNILEKTFKKPGDSKDYLDTGNYVEATAQHYVIVSDDEGTRPALIVMKSTQLKKSRKWNSMIMSVKLLNKEGKPFNPASFAFAYRLFTSKESNDKGTWYGWEVERIGLAEANVYAEAKAFSQAIRAGQVQVKHTEDGEAAPVETNAF
jgi:hypothetical protein